MNASPWHKTGLRTIQGFPEYTLPQIRALYRDMDANGDGKVTLAEMTSMIVKYMDVAEEVGVGRTKVEVAEAEAEAEPEAEPEAEGRV